MDEFSAEMKKRLIAKEALKLKPYRCPEGKLTIGVGRNIEDNGITREEAMILLENDIRAAVSALTLIFGTRWLDFTFRRRIALTDMMFNLGEYRFKGFKKMIRAILEGDWKQAAVEAMDSKWATQVGKRATEVAEMLRGG